MGLFAVDRFALGHIGIAVGKMITLGGLGLWWIVDIILLISGKLMPQDDSNWIVQHWIFLLKINLFLQWKKKKKFEFYLWFKKEDD